MFTIHTLFLRLRFRLVRQEIPLRVGFQIRSSLRTKERGPLRQAQGPFSVRSVSLPNWRLISGTGVLYGQWACRTGGWYQGPENLCGMPAFALKGQNVIAQGNALGKCPNKTFSPERAKGFDIWLLRPFRAYLMGDLLPGVALRFTPGYHISPLRGLGTTAHHSQCMLDWTKGGLKGIEKRVGSWGKKKENENENEKAKESKRESRLH